MASKMVDFLLELNQNPKLIADFGKDPEGTLAQSGLPREAQDVLKTRDPVRIRQAIAQELGIRDELLEGPTVRVVVRIEIHVII